MVVAAVLESVYIKKYLKKEEKTEIEKEEPTVVQYGKDN